MRRVGANVPEQPNEDRPRLPRLGREADGQRIYRRWQLILAHP